ncbi:homoserine kinase [Shinella sp. CPCC 101442]|uniref:homoserine kinase n=1 Tax=Shinella sp. CPCC 101442 TaxID=2932265 RepID=UPI0021522DBC|nr:homoserine kinase [Shinella sp. CPCC 101442]MCR6502432.1 homoserine kinase [Shinella sp. CPCC 101442]
MAVFTELHDEDRDAIAAAYEMHSLSSVIGIADGDTETTYLFRTGQGEFIVTLFENGAEPLDLERAFKTMELLQDRGVPCPRPVRTIEGQATFKAAGRLVAVVSFVSGSSTGDPTAAKCESLGRVMAQIHTVLRRGLHGRPDILPTGAVHGALVPSNVFFVGDMVSGVINFRLRHDDALVSEIAEALVDWTIRANGELDRTKARSMLKGYQSVRALTGAERAALPGFVMASAARRYANRAEKACLPTIAMLTFSSVTPDILD